MKGFKMVIKEVQKDYKNYFIFFTKHHSVTEISVHNYKNDNFSYRNRYIGYSINEIFKQLKDMIDNNLLKNEGV